MVRQDFDLVGGRLCLDFVNTVSWRGTREPKDALDSYEALLRWGVCAGTLSRTEASAMGRIALESPRSGVVVLARARELREAIYRIVRAWKRGRPPRREDLALVNASAPARNELLWDRGRFVWIRERSRRLEKMLWPVVWSLADLVTLGERRRLGACDSSQCGWLFYDESRGLRRRWCSMSDCGNRAKARRHYARTRGQPP